MSKTLNDHLFDTLNRLSEVDSENLETEMNKATSIISVSEQILNVARLKLDIIAAGANVVDQFAEIDGNNHQRQISNPPVKKIEPAQPKIIEEVANKTNDSVTLSDTYPELLGRKIKIFNGKDVFWAKAEVTDYEGTLLHLKNVEFFNHTRKDTYQIEEKNITRIELVEEPE